MWRLHVDGVANGGDDEHDQDIGCRPLALLLLRLLLEVMRSRLSSKTSPKA